MYIYKNRIKYVIKNCNNSFFALRSSDFCFHNLFALCIENVHLLSWFLLSQCMYISYIFIYLDLRTFD